MVRLGQFALKHILVKFALEENVDLKMQINVVVLKNNNYDITENKYCSI